MHKAVIFDVDGTLANVEPYLHHIRNIYKSPDFKKDYDKFHSESVNAEPNQEVVDMVNKTFFDQNHVIVVTSRNEYWRGITSYWLAKNDIGHHALYMRKDGDFRPDYEVKSEILAKIKKQWNVIHAIDDNPAVLKLWFEHGISTTKIGDWDGSRD
jgi:phosphoglycolate phosphatase-like HAD superfamily hydrolase